MNNRKRWANKEVAQNYFKAMLKSGHIGLSFASVCDYLGILPTEAIEAHKQKERGKDEKRKVRLIR